MVFTVVKEIDIRFRICNNLDLIGHSAFVIETYFYPGPGGVGRDCQKCRVFYQIKIIADPKPHINFLHDCENRMRSINVNIHCGMKITILVIPIKFGLLVLGLDVEKRVKVDETLSKLNKR